MEYVGVRALPVVEEEPVHKLSHHFKEGHRVRVVDQPHLSGTITHLDDHNRVHVKLDSGHFVHGRPEEFQPEDWQGHHASAESKIRKTYTGAALPTLDDFDVDSDRLAKRLKTTLSVGQTVRDRHRGLIAKITRIEGELAHFDYEDGTTGSAVLSYAEAHMIPV